ncbi:VOC family protein [Sphingomonas nostoxanthinifaciens]|uniref:VOC family protein n=1 Tax=Sphingomonas nostoxanthinifaciens TaxID=2872652 RepID=UPI001CC1E3B4|nr:VOC family protein [Sphingomonas nostoxanthinifaciens]UAK23486.1 VOC family protein [Sphingomonas nostoxanthinifaciens]
MAPLQHAKAMTFVVTADRARAKAFYADVLGFPPVHEDQFACVFDLNGTALRLSEAEAFRPQPHTVLGWQVGDIVATIEELRAKGVVFTIYDGFGQDVLGIWSPPGGDTKVAWFQDPDGNVLSVAQFAPGAAA